VSLNIFAVPVNELTRAQTAQIIDLCSAVFRLDCALHMNLELLRATAGQVQKELGRLSWL
jgi:hypothetical protein